MISNKQQSGQSYLSLIYKYVYERLNDKNEQFYVCSNEDIRKLVQTEKTGQEMLLENGGYAEVNKLDIYNSKIELTESYSYKNKTSISSLFDPLDIKHTLLLQIGEGNDEIVLTDVVGHAYNIEGLIPKYQSFDFSYLLPGRTDLLLYQLDGIDINIIDDDGTENQEAIQANYVMQLFPNTNTFKIIYSNMPKEGNPENLMETYPREFTGRNAVYLTKNRKTNTVDINSEEIDSDIHTIAFVTYHKNKVMMYLQYSSKTGKLYTSGSGIQLDELIKAAKPYVYNVVGNKIVEGYPDDIQKRGFDRSGYIDVDKALYKFNNGKFGLVRKSFYGVTQIIDKTPQGLSGNPTELLNNDGEVVYIDSEDIDNKPASIEGLDLEIGQRVRWVIQQISLGESMRYHDLYITKFSQAILVYKYIYRASKYIQGEQVVDTIKIVFMKPVVDVHRNQQVYMNSTGDNIYIKQEDYAQDQQFKQLANNATRKLVSNKLYQVMPTGEVRMLGNVVRSSGNNDSEMFELDTGLIVKDIKQTMTPWMRTAGMRTVSDKLVRKTVSYRMSTDIGVRLTWF